MHSPITRLLPSSVDIVRVSPLRRPVVHKPLLRLLLAVEINVFEVESVDVAGEIAQKCQEDVDEQVCAATGYEVDADGWDWGKCVSRE